MNINELVSLFWGEKEILRGPYKQKDYGDIILPFVLLRRIGRVLEPSKDKVLKEYEKIKKLDESFVDAKLNKISGYGFHNKTKHDMRSLLDDPDNIHRNLKQYIGGFSDNIQDIFENFNFIDIIKGLDKHKLLYRTVERFESADVSPEKVDNHMMGTIYEELIRQTQEAGNEEAGEHFTPREVIGLLSKLILLPEKNNLSQEGIIRTVYDPAVGTGGMLSIASEQIREINPNVQIEGYGQELNAQSYAICKSDMLIKGLKSDNIKFGEKSGSLADQDGFPDQKFHYMLSNPPYGVDWGKYAEEVKDEAEKGFSGKYGAGLPRKSDGSLLFVMQMISKMKPVDDGGSRIGIVLNGSPLFTGAAESGESDIRKWIIGNDYLEAIIALPNSLFYNTSISTYIWIVTNRKEKQRAGKVQLINAVSFFENMKTPLGNKRHKILKDQISEIIKIYQDFKPNDFCKIFENKDFAYTRITVDRPLKRNFQATEERIERLKQESAFVKIADAKLKPKEPKQEDVKAVLKKMPSKLYKDSEEFSNDLKDAFSHADFKLSSSLQKAIEKSLSERDETAVPAKDSKGNLKADSDLRDYENIPVTQDIDEYFEKEVTKYVPDAWIVPETRDKIGYEIPLTRHFYVYKPLRPLEEIDTDLKANAEEIQALQKNVLG